MTSSLLTIYAHVRPSLSTLETTLCLSVSISVYICHKSLIFLYISLSLCSFYNGVILSFLLYLSVSQITFFLSTLSALSIYVVYFFLFSLSQSFSICLILASSLCHIRYTVTSLFLFRFILQCLPYPVFAHLFSSCLRQEMLKLTLLKLWQFHSWTESLVLFFFLSFFQSNPTR